MSIRKMTCHHHLGQNRMAMLGGETGRMRKGVAKANALLLSPTNDLSSRPRVDDNSISIFIHLMSKYEG